MVRKSLTYAGFVGFLVGAFTYANSDKSSDNTISLSETAYAAPETSQGQTITPVHYVQFCAEPERYLPQDSTLHLTASGLEMELSREERQKVTLFTRKPYTKTIIIVATTTPCGKDIAVDHLLERKYHNNELLWESPRNAEEYGGEHAVNTLLQQEVFHVFEKRFSTKQRY